MFSFESDEDSFVRFVKDLLARKIIKLKSKLDNDVDEDEDVDFNNYNDKTKLLYVSYIPCGRRKVLGR